jgi:hypothetical protein
MLLHLLLGFVSTMANDSKNYTSCEDDVLKNSVSSSADREEINEILREDSNRWQRVVTVSHDPEGYGAFLDSLLRIKLISILRYIITFTYATLRNPLPVTK